jgi:hypothetical protein
MFPPLPFFQDAMEDYIIFSIDDEPPSSPPRSLLPLMLTCRRFYNLLCPSNNPRLYRRIFYRKFDTAALSRRFPSSSIDIAAYFFPELKRRFQAMRCIRSGDVHHPQLQDALLAAYLMVLEHDALNYRHLLDAALPALLDRYINERLHRGHNLWPMEDTCNALAVALFWHMTSQGAWTIVLRFLSFGESAPLPPSGALNGESDDSRDNIMDILLPLTFAWFRVRPFRSLSPLPFFRPDRLFPLRSGSTHLQSKASTLTRSYTGVTLRRAYPTTRIPPIPPHQSRSTTWATLFACSFLRLPLALRSRILHGLTRSRFLPFPGNQARSIAQQLRTSSSQASPSEHGRFLADRASRKVISPSGASVRAHAMIGIGCAA